MTLLRMSIGDLVRAARRACLNLGTDFYTVYSPDTPGPRSGMPEDPKTKTILIVDDDDDIRDLLVAIIEKEGFKVRTALNGLEALDSVKERAPDLILLDLMMPRFAGYEVVRRLQQGPTAKIPILVMSGRYKDKKTTDMVKAEPNVLEFLEKPVSPAILAETVHKTLNTKAAA